MAVVHSSVRVEFDKIPDVIAGLIRSQTELVTKVGSDIEATAKDSMVGGGEPHVPSLPGDPPHVDTGNLKNSIRFAMVDDANGEVAVGAEYGAHLEYGTARMAARPYMTPAVDDVAGKLADIGVAVVKKALP